MGGRRRLLPRKYSYSYSDIDSDDFDYSSGGESKYERKKKKNKPKKGASIKSGSYCSNSLLVGVLTIIVVLLLVLVVKLVTGSDEVEMVCKGTRHEDPNSREFRCDVPKGYSMPDDVIALDKEKEKKSDSSLFWIAAGITPILLFAALYGYQKMQAHSGSTSKGSKGKSKYEKYEIPEKRHKSFNRFNGRNRAISDEYYSDYSYSSVSEDYYY